MQKKNHLERFTRSRSALLLTGAIYAAAMAPQVQAFSFDLGEEVSGNLDITLGYANLFRTEDSDRSDWWDLTKTHSTDPNATRYGGYNDLSERRVPDAGDLVSQVGSVTAELDLTWRNFGFVGAGSFKYDTEIMDRGMDRGELAGTGVQWTESTRKYAGNPVELLDAYVWGEFEVGDNPLEVRLGKQVINWGEGLYFLNGVSTQVPLNFNKLFTPGSELKEAYIGNEAIFASMGIGDNSSVEAYYQFGWNRAEFAPQGTWFGVDVLYRGSNSSEIQGGDNVTNAIAGAPFGMPFRAYADRQAKDDGQWGISFKTAIEDTEYGIYYSRYHESRPFIYGNFTDTLGAGLPASTSVGGLLFGLDFGHMYAEDQDMYGASFSTTVGDWSLAGEVAYRPDQALFGDTLQKGYFDGPFGISGTNIHENDTINASINGIWLGGPTILGIDSQFALYQLGLEHISGDRSKLAAQGLITRQDDGKWLTDTASGLNEITPDKTAMGAAFAWAGTWKSVMPGTNLTLDVFLQHGLFGNSHYYGNFAEDHTFFATGLTAAIGNDWEAGISYSGMVAKNSDYEDQDTIGLAVNYKF